jgi:acyl carrier protein
MTLTELVAAVLQVPAEQVTDDTASHHLDSWNSLAQIKLVVALEEAYSVTLSAADIKAMTSVGRARRLLVEKGAAVG